MTYAATAVSGSATPALALVQNVEAALTANAAWAFSEQITSGSYICRIWRCLGSANGLGSDFYVALMYTADTATSVWLRAAEFYDTATDTLVRPATPGVTTTHAPTSTNLWAHLGNTTLAWSNVTSTQMGVLPTATTVAATMTTYVLVTNKTVVFGTSTGGSWHIAGLYTPWLPHSDDFPLYNGVISGNVGISRAPGRTATAGWRQNTLQGLSALTSGQVGTTGYAPSDQASPSPCLVTGVSLGGVMGNVDAVACYNNASAVVRGDTLTAGSKSFLCIIPGSGTMGYFLDTSL